MGEDDPESAAAAAVAAAVPNTSGGSLADYVVEKAIGRGHFSTVHRAVRRSDERRVALKKVQKRLDASVQARMAALEQRVVGKLAALETRMTGGGGGDGDKASRRPQHLPSPHFA